MPSFGEKLKLEREKRKITLEQISISTKIGTRMLEALEQDKFNQLPGGIFNKGFVRAYSRFVGLDEDQIVADYLQASGDAPPVSVEIYRDNQARNDRDKDDRDKDAHELGERVNLAATSDTTERQLPWGWLAAVLLILALGLFFWRHRERDPEVQSIEPAPVKSAVPRTNETAASSSSNVNSANAGSAAPSSNSTSPIVPPAPTVTAPKNAPAVSQPAPPGPGEFTVAIHVREESWISINADGKSVSSELLFAGSDRTVHARKEITLKVGNAGGVDLQFNGKKVTAAGDFGEVKTVTFGPEGLLPATSSRPAAQ